MDYSIVWVRGHVEVFDWAGRFCFSADSEREALDLFMTLNKKNQALVDSCF